VAGVPPDGEPASSDGALPGSSLEGLGSHPFGLYVHVPYCSTRCGYCDFNTYTAAELGGGASQATYVDQAVQEVRLARRVLGERAPSASTVFVGGGTPTLLPANDLGRVLRAVREEFGVITGAEVTTEANPDSVTPASLATLLEAGFTRISFGMQSAVEHVLGTLDRTHTAGRATAAVGEAKAAGFSHVNLDLIYGTPGESLQDWSESLEVALAAEPDHVSAYALIVEQGTRLAGRVRRGELAMPDDDDLADKYLLADDRLGAAGFEWYEVSNWATGAESESAHNRLYWTGADWWGIGPGAHSHVAGTRWWNVRHPAAYAERLDAGLSPAQAREVLDPAARQRERVLLEIRLRSGLPIEVLDDRGRRAAEAAVVDGLLEREALHGGRAVLTRRGRLLADAVVRSLV
jgi:putative oxygen-independent coproporphyrinogen III oxidase